MKRWFQQLRHLIVTFRERESAQRAYMRAIYQAPHKVPANYERPAYLRRARVVACA